MYNLYMALVFHLIVAFGSIIYAAYAYWRPSKSKLYATYFLVVMTFITGFFLVFTKPAHMVEVCTLGLAYLGVVSVGIVSARNKLASITIRQ